MRLILVKSANFLFLLISSISWLLISCESMKNMDLSNKNDTNKELFISKRIVKSVLENPILKYRKINRARVLVEGNNLIISNAHDGISSVDKSSGETKWSFYVKNGVESAPILFKDNLYFGGNDGYFYSVKVKSGIENWKVSIKTEVVSTPAFDAKDGRIYFVSTGNSLYSLEAESGKIAWTYTRQDPSSYSIRGATTPVIKDGLLFVGFSEGSFVAFNKSNGTISWEIQLNKNKKFKDIDATAVIDHDKIFVSGYDDKLYCLSLNNGEIIWRFDSGGYVPVVIYYDSLMYSSTAGKVFSINKNTGQKNWEYSQIEGVPTQVTVYNDLIVFGESQGNFKVLHPKTGKLINSFEPGRGIFSPITADEKSSMVYFISGESNLYQLEVKWKRKNLFSFVD